LCRRRVDLLLRAAAQLPPDTHVRLIGSGPEQARLAQLAADLGLAARVSFETAPSLAMPARLAALDCLVLPSRSRPNWKEQFGRVLIEAMACGVPVVGAACGEIPSSATPVALPDGDVPPWPRTSALSMPSRPIAPPSGPLAAPASSRTTPSSTSRKPPWRSTARYWRPPPDLHAH
jgi:hypothetical protein